MATLKQQPLVTGWGRGLQDRPPSGCFPGPEMHQGSPENEVSPWEQLAVRGLLQIFQIPHSLPSQEGMQVKVTFKSHCPPRTYKMNNKKGETPRQLCLGTARNPR